MCAIDDAEPCEFMDARFVTARKSHKCDECKRPIAAKEEYERVAAKWNGEFHSMAICSHCVAAREYLNRECNGYAYGVIREDLEEHWQDGGSLELAKIVVGLRRKWTTIKGTLMPLPQVARPSGDNGR